MEGTNTIIEDLKELMVKKQLRLLLLDDDAKNSIPTFKSDANKYNRDSDIVEIMVKTEDEILAAIRLLKEYKFDAFVCDHNMPVKCGLDLINFLQKEYDDPYMVYVLYTGGANITGDIIKECKEKRIIFFSKNESFSTLVEQIVKERNHKMSLQKQESGCQTGNDSDIEIEDDVYKHLLPDIIDDLENIEKLDPSYRLISGESSYSPAQIMNELLERTPTGRKFIINYLDGLTFFKNFKNK